MSRQVWWKRVRSVALLTVCVLGACSGGPPIATTQISGSVRSPLQSGITYYLPKVVFELGVWEVVDMTTVTIEAQKKGEIERNEYSESEPRHFAAIMDTMIVPDRNYLMRITSRPSASFHEKIDVEIAPDGLLTHVKTTFKDETRQIVANLTTLGTTLLQAPKAFDMAKARAGERKGVTRRIRLMRTLIVDPTDPTTHAPLAEYGITLDAQPMVSEACCALNPNSACEPVGTRAGVCYRPVIPFTVTIRPGGRYVDRDTANRVVGFVEIPHGIQQEVMLPNVSPVVCLSIDRKAFVESTFSAKFDRGLLTSVVSNKPSEIVGFLQIPIDVAKAIVSIPGQLLQIKIDHYEKSSAANDAESEALKSIRELSNTKQGASEPPPK